MKKINEALQKLADIDYKEFNSALIPNIDKNTVIGVRIPALRKLARELFKTNIKEALMSELPHEFYEENLLHAFFIEQIKDFDECIFELERFLPYIDNWAVCDSLCPKILIKYQGRLLEKIYEWLKSPHEYTVRFALKMLMAHFLDERFSPEYLKAAASINREEYYIKMMVAWYFSTALAKQYDFAIGYIESRHMPMWIHNKTIQKATESKRISDGQKCYLRTLIVK